MRLIASLLASDRHSIEQLLFSLYDATVHLIGT